MSECRFPRTRLMAWLDGEAGEQAEAVREHVERCPACAAEVECWRSAGDELRSVIDAGLGQVDPLAARHAGFPSRRFANSKPHLHRAPE